MKGLALSIIRKLSCEDGLDVFGVSGEDKSRRDAGADFGGSGIIYLRCSLSFLDCVAEELQVLVGSVGGKRFVDKVDGYMILLVKLRLGRGLGSYVPYGRRNRT